MGYSPSVILRSEAHTSPELGSPSLVHIGYIPILVDDYAFYMAPPVYDKNGLVAFFCPVLLCLTYHSLRNSAIMEPKTLPSTPTSNLACPTNQETVRDFDMSQD
jgi:hypothetical protein